jgi:GNAT superfamily N-acetyltransferase
VLLTRDGSPLTVRPIAPGDAPALVALHARLSGETVLRRYFGPRPELAPSLVARFTDVREEWRFALVAVREPGDLVAVARYEGRPEPAAEIALVVDDALQRHGVGRALLLRLIDVAVLRGIESLVADVLAVNTPMITLLRGLGLPTRSVVDGSALVITLDLRGVELDAQRADRARRHVALAGVLRSAAPRPPVG